VQVVEAELAESSTIPTKEARQMKQVPSQHLKKAISN